MRTRSRSAFYVVRVLLPLSLSLAALAIALLIYERYQTQHLLNNNVAKAADNYAGAMRNLNDQLERFEKQR